MALLVPPIATELDGLLAFLDQQRRSVRAGVYRLTDDELSSKPTVSALSMVGILKHVALTEQHWTVRIAQQRDLPDFPPYELQFRLAPDETVDDVLGYYASVAADTERWARSLPSLDTPVPVPRGVPWFPQDIEAWSARWVLLHLIEETARHAGQGDIIRESIDGATLFPLLAAYENGTEIQELVF